MAAVLVEMMKAKKEQETVVVKKGIRVRPWVRSTVLALALGTTAAVGMNMYMDKPVLEDNVQWVSVVVPEGKGYDAAIQAAYIQVGADMDIVDIRDLRDLAQERNDNKALYAGATILVPVYMGTTQYRK